MKGLGNTAEAYPTPPHSSCAAPLFPKRTFSPSLKSCTALLPCAAVLQGHLPQAARYPQLPGEWLWLRGVFVESGHAAPSPSPSAPFLSDITMCAAFFLSVCRAMTGLFLAGPRSTPTALATGCPVPTTGGFQTLAGFKCVEHAHQRMWPHLCTPTMQPGHQGHGTYPSLQRVHGQRAV